MTVMLNNFLTVYENPIPYIPNRPNNPSVNTFTLTVQQSEPIVVDGPMGPMGPAGKSGNRFSSRTQTQVFITPINGGTIIFQVATGLAYIYGTPVYVSSLNTITNNFTGEVLEYDTSTGFIVIGKVSLIHGSFTTSNIYTINVLELTSIGPQGDQGPTGIAGNMGATGYIGPTGPIVPFSGGTSLLITMFQDGFDCGDVDE